jgi:hypothetical protein
MAAGLVGDVMVGNPALTHVGYLPENPVPLPQPGDPFVAVATEVQRRWVEAFKDITGGEKPPLYLLLAVQPKKTIQP